MDADVRSSDVAPGPFRQGHDDRVSGDRNRRVFGLWRHVGERHRYGVLSRVTVLKLGDFARRVCVLGV